MSKYPQFEGKKFLVMGLGLHGGGVGVIKWLAKHNYHVKVTDLKTKQQLVSSLKKLKKYKKVTYRLGKHRAVDFKEADIIIANPIVRSNNKYLKIAGKNGASIYNDASLFINLCPAKIIGITGTKGKSTTAALIYQLLKQAKLPVYLGGNIRISPFIFLDKLKKSDLVVLELSSWQCEGLRTIKKSPQISVLTNIGIDHLDSYETFSDYVRAKQLIFKYQSKSDYAVLNRTDQISGQIEKQIKAKKKYFSLKNKKDNFIKEGYLYYQAKRVLALDRLSIYGQHNYANILAALAVSQIFDLSPKTVKQALTEFKNLDGRMELIKIVRGVKYINDTTATAPTAAIAGLSSIKDPIVLIAGGTDKKLDFKIFCQSIIRNVKYLILLPGSATDRIIKILKTKGFNKYSLVKTMQLAVKKAANLTIKGDVVLLSPAAASFGLFANEFDRGKKFEHEVQLLK